MKKPSKKKKTGKHYYEDEITVKELTMVQLNFVIAELKAKQYPNGNRWHEDGKLYKAGDYYCQRMVKEFPATMVTLA
jgi:hypothetical protein